MGTRSRRLSLEVLRGKDMRKVTLTEATRRSYLHRVNLRFKEGDGHSRFQKYAITGLRSRNVPDLFGFPIFVSFLVPGGL